MKKQSKQADKETAGNREVLFEGRTLTKAELNEREVSLLRDDDTELELERVLEPIWNFLNSSFILGNNPLSHMRKVFPDFEWLYVETYAGREDDYFFSKKYAANYTFHLWTKVERTIVARRKRCSFRIAVFNSGETADIELMKSDNFRIIDFWKESLKKRKTN